MASKRNKHQHKAQQQKDKRPPVQMLPASPNLPDLNSSTQGAERLKQIRAWFTRFIGAAAVTTLINVCLLYMNCQQVKIGKETAASTERQAQLAKEAIDRATGKVTAHFEFADSRPLMTQFRDDQKVALFGRKELTNPFYNDANAMVLLPPSLFLNNVGEDAIDAVRVETSFIEGIIDRPIPNLDFTKPPPAPPSDWYKFDTPVLLRMVDREEYTLPQQWKPGQSLHVPILRSVLGQLTQVQSKTAADKMHSARLEITVSARLTGSSFFDADGTKVNYMVTWMPKGFPDEEIKRVLDTYQPKLEVGQKVTPRLPLRKGQREDFLLFGDAPNWSRPESLDPKK